MAIPEAGANILVIGVVRTKQRVGVRRAPAGSARELAADFQSGRESSHVWNAAGIRISPPVASVAEVEVICNAGRNVLSQTDSIDPRILGLRADCGILALGVAGEEPADIPLVSDSVGQLVVVVGAVEVPTLGEIMVDAGNAEVAGLGSSDGARVTAEVQFVSLAAVVGQG